MTTSKTANARSTFILKMTIWLIGTVVLGLCIFVLPVGIMTDTSGYFWPILAGMYVTVIPFFYALYQALKLLDYIDKNKAFTTASVEALRRIKYAAGTISVLYALGLPYLFSVATRDDTPGIFKLGMVVVFASFVIATAAGVFERLFQNAVEIKSENDLTV